MDGGHLEQGDGELAQELALLVAVLVEDGELQNGVDVLHLAGAPPPGGEREREKEPFSVSRPSRHVFLFLVFQNFAGCMN